MQEAKRVEQAATTAAELIDPDHPLHQAFVSWCKRTRDSEPTKRMARKYLREHPMYRTARRAA